MREPPRHDSFDDLFDDDLRVRMAVADADHRATLASRLVTTVSLVMNRRTPLRGVEAFGSEGVCRLSFADGTVFLARSTGKGGLGLAAVAVTRGSAVLVTGMMRDGSVVRAVVSWDGHPPVEVVVVGTDQPR